MILVTITRIAGIKLHGQIDIVWESYFTIVAAEVGVILASISTYRALYVAHKKAAIKKARYGVCRSFQHGQTLRRLMDSSSWRSRAERKLTPSDNTREHLDKVNFPSIPRAHMTGVRTFINGHEESMDDSSIMLGPVVHDHDCEKATDEESS